MRIILQALIAFVALALIAAQAEGPKSVRQGKAVTPANSGSDPGATKAQQAPAANADDDPFSPRYSPHPRPQPPDGAKLEQGKESVPESTRTLQPKKRVWTAADLRPQPLPEEREAVLAALNRGGGVGYNDRGRVNSVTCEDATDADVRLFGALGDLEWLLIGPPQPMPFESYVGHPEVTDAGLTTLAKARKLHVLRLNETQVTGEGLRAIGPLTDIESLELCSPQITGAGMVYLERLQRLRNLYLWGGVGDDGMRAVARLKSLQRLQLGGAVTEKGLRELESLTSLERLDLEKFVTDADLAAIGRITNLTTLKTKWTDVTDGGLKGLVHLSKLRTLDLSKSKVGDEGMAYVARLAGLKTLTVPPRIGDAGLAYLAESQSISNLDLSRSRITDAGLAKLQKMDNLRFLLLGGTKITDAGVPELAKVHKLRFLWLPGTKVTATGVRRLRGARSLEEINVSNTDISDDQAFSMAEMGIPVTTTPSRSSGMWGRE